MSDLQYPLLTRQGGIDLIQRELGISVSHSKIERDLIDGKGPQPVRRFGRRLLYEADEFVRYGKTLITEIPPGGLKGGPGRPRKVERRP